jgi:uncharacterized protein with HEPN domain
MDRFQKEYHLTRIGLFGSVARGEQSENSDIDLIVEFEEGTADLFNLYLSRRYYQRQSMHSPSHKDFSCISNMLDSINKILEYSDKYNDADEFYNETIAFDASMMNFIVIGEMVDKLSEGFKEETSAIIDWQKVKSFRNIIAHNYFGIDAEEVWQIIKTSLVELKKNLGSIIN